MDNINIRCEAIVMNPSSHPLKNLPVTKAEASTIPKVQTSLLLHFCNERWSPPFRRVLTSSSSCFKSVTFSTLLAKSSMVRRRVVPADSMISSVVVTGPWTVIPEVNVPSVAVIEPWTVISVVNVVGGAGAQGPRLQVPACEKSTSPPPATLSYVYRIKEEKKR